MNTGTLGLTVQKRDFWWVLIEQINKIELKVLGRFGCIYSPATGYFYDKTKISSEYLRVNYYLQLKYCRRQCTLLFPTWAKSLTKFILKC